MNIQDLFPRALQLVKSNAPEILTALGVSGMITTSYLTAKATFDASNVINHAQYMEDLNEKSHSFDFKEKTKLVWKIYIPATLSGAMTIGCIIGASKSTGRRTAAAVTAYSLTERAFSEYKEKVVEQLGEAKEQKVRDTIAQDHISKNPSGSHEVVILGSGNVLCCELFTHRYFRSDMERLRKAQNDVNAQINSQMYVSLDDFYDIIDIQHTSLSDKIGWDSDKLMALEFSTVLSDSGEPCLAFDYNYTKPLR